jgi:hypothetical protein
LGQAAHQLIGVGQYLSLLVTTGEGVADAAHPVPLVIRRDADTTLVFRPKRTMGGHARTGGVAVARSA